MSGNNKPLEYAIKSQPLRVCDMPARLRPREEFERVGAENVSDAVLLALILRTGTKGINVIEVSQRLLSNFGSLTALAKATVKDLQSVESIGPVKAQMIKAAMELAQRLTRESVGESPIVATPEQAAAVLRERCASNPTVGNVRHQFTGLCVPQLERTAIRIGKRPEHVRQQLFPVRRELQTLRLHLWADDPRLGFRLRRVRHREERLGFRRVRHRVDPYMPVMAGKLPTIGRDRNIRIGQFARLHGY